MAWWTRRIAIALGLAAALAGCAADRATSRSANAEALPELALEEEFRIGSVDDPDEGFSFIGPVAVGPDGRIYVAELMERHVRVYHSDGRLDRVIGRAGSGPGEFAAVGSMGFIGDTLWVADPGNVRITFFTPGGDILRTMRASPVAVSVDGPPGSVLLWPAAPRPDGRWEGAAAVGVGTDSVSFSYPNLVFGRTGAVVDTLGVRHVRLPPSRIEVGGVNFPAEYTLPSWPLVRRTAGDTVVVERPVAGSEREAAFTVTRIDAAADTVFHTRLRYLPQVVDDAYVERIIGLMANTPRQSTAPAAIESALRSLLPLFHPPVSHVRLGEDGSVYLRREDDGGERRQWLLISPDGGPLGRIRLPRNARIAWARGNDLITIEPDELNVQWLVRYRIARAYGSEGNAAE